MAVQIAIPQKKEKGGLFGQIARIGGSAIGLGLAPFTGGTSIPIGAAAGQAVGGVADAAEGKTNPLQAALQVGQSAGSIAGKVGDSNALKTAAAANPDFQEATIKGAIKDASNLPLDQQKQVTGPLFQGLDILEENKRLRQGVIPGTRVG